MAIETPLSCYRGEVHTVSWSSTDAGLNVTGRPLVFRLLKARNGETLTTLAVGSGVTITGNAAATIVIPGTATDLEPGDYYWSFADTGIPVLYSYGKFTIHPPMAKAG